LDHAPAAIFRVSERRNEQQKQAEMALGEGNGLGQELVLRLFWRRMQKIAHLIRRCLVIGSILVLGGHTVQQGKDKAGGGASPRIIIKQKKKKPVRGPADNPRQAPEQ
jgi:hypothetical protein